MRDIFKMGANSNLAFERFKKPTVLRDLFLSRLVPLPFNINYYIYISSHTPSTPSISL